VDDAVQVRDAGHKGRGVFALRDFSPGDLILRFERGRVVHTDEPALLSPWEREHLGELTAETCLILPPPRCYVNHACAPNAISSSESLLAWRDIRTGEEITIDYRLNSLDTWEMICACAAYTHPHLVIGDFFTLPGDLQDRYLPYAPPFVQQECLRRHGTVSYDTRHSIAQPLWPTVW
jgi:hypothetical protein